MEITPPKIKIAYSIDVGKRDEMFRRLLTWGIREKRSKMGPNARKADPNRIRHRKRHKVEKVSDREREQRLRNWKRSKVGRAHARKMRRHGFETKTGEQIRTELAAKRSARDERRLERRLNQAGWEVARG